MAPFFSPLNKSWSTSKKMSLLLYSIFFSTSVWACGQSLARTLGAAELLSYALAFSTIATASFCLNLVKTSLSNGYVASDRPAKLLFGTVGFIALWFSILMANTHNIYYVMTIDSQRQKELREVKNQMELIGDKSVAAFNAAKTKFTSEIESEIRNVKDEIQNPNNPGAGRITDEIIHRVEEKLGQNIEMPSNQPTDLTKQRQYAELIATKIREATKQKLSTIDEKINELSIFLSKEDYKNTQKRLDELITNYNNKTEQELVQGLRNSYSTYKKSQEYIDQLFSEPLIRNNTTILIDKLPSTPISIETQNIAYCWGEFFKGDNVNTTRFWWAIFIAFILDLACFLFWYFGVLAEE